MPNAVHFPADYARFDSVELCGNTLRNVVVVFQIDEHVPLWVGRGGSGMHPRIWLSALGPQGQWIELLRANAVTRPMLNPAQGALMVLQDATKPQTVVMLGQVVVVNAVSAPDESSVTISSIDLRPLGLNIYGNSTEGGLNFGGNRWVRNTLSNVQTAFAANLGKQ